MKRELFENVLVDAYTAGNAVDRLGYLSAVLRTKVSGITGSPTAAQLTVTVTDSAEANGTFAPVEDDRLFPDGAGGVYMIDMTASTPGLDKSVMIDLIGCKQFVKIAAAVSFTGGTTPAASTTLVLALGDPRLAPVVE